MGFLLYVGTTVGVSMLVEPRLWPTAAGMLVGLLSVTFAPGTLVAALVLTNVVFVVNIAVIWWPGRFRGTYDGDARVR